MRTSAVILLMALSGLGSGPAVAAEVGMAACCDQRCERCGRYAACVPKMCQVVCEMKKETKTCWCAESHEICPLMPGCHHCGDGCPPEPRCGKPICVKKLVKEYQVDVPVYKCVVWNVCPACLESGVGDASQARPGPRPALRRPGNRCPRPRRFPAAG